MPAGASQTEGRGLLEELIIRFLCACVGATLGGILVFWPLRKRPTLQDLKFKSDLYERKSKEYKSLCQDFKTGLDVIATFVASLSMNESDAKLNKVIHAIDSLQQAIADRSGDSHLRTPFDGFALQGGAAD